MLLDAYLLTRHWRDTPQGLEISLWAASEHGAIHLRVHGQKPVCFIENSHPLAPIAGVERRPLKLTLLHGERVDGLYFRRQRDLQELRQREVSLCESDIKPVDRYLMERFIRAPIRIEGELERIDNHWQIQQPRLQPGNYQPSLKTVAIDIETRAYTQQLYSVAAACMPKTTCAKAAGNQVVFMIGDGESEWREDFLLHYFSNERDLLNAFFDWVIDTDPDALCGWAVVNFDLDFIVKKCQSLRMQCRLGRGGETATVLQPGQPGTPRIARVPGRAVFDGIDLLKAGFWNFDSFSLDAVSHELLGTGKLIGSEQDKVAEINHLFRHDKPALAAYNIRDCTLVNEIFSKAQLLPFAIQRANLTGLALDRLGGSVAAFDNLYLPRLHRAGFVAPDIDARDDTGSSPGGHVMDSVPGLFRNVLVLDFKSLYPSIIRTFLIDPLGLAEPGENPVPGFLDASYSRSQHILPALIEDLWSARDAAKQDNNAPLSQAIKIIMNSFYGVLGSGGCRFHSPQLASSITRRGHQIITRSREWIEQRGYPVIYGDTDSVFVHVGSGVDAAGADAIGVQLVQGLNHFWCQELQETLSLESHLEVEYETHYSRFFMPTVRGMSTGSKKRYAGLVANPDSPLVIKGLEAARTDWTPLARDFQRELFRRILSELPFEDFVRDTATRLQAGELDDQLVYTKRIRRALSDYQRNVPPHIQAARKLRHSGNTIRYLITRNGPEPIDELQSRPDYQHYLDRQLAPAADGILQFMETSFGKITDAQLQMF